MFTKSLLTLAAIITLSHHSLAADDINVIVDLPLTASKGLVVIAPAKKYLMQERLFSAMAKKLRESGYTTVRFNWSAKTLTEPELELTRASEDMYKVITEAQTKFNVSAEKTILISKSFSTKALSASVSLAKTHIMLTPNCTADTTFEQTYSDILSNDAISLSMMISNEDPNCDVRQIHGALAKLSRLPGLFTTRGDHNFVLRTSDGQSNFTFQDQVIELVSKQIEAIRE